MRRVFYYADLELRASVAQDRIGWIDSLTHNEILLLSQQLYLTITTFLNTRALYLADKEKEGGS